MSPERIPVSINKTKYLEDGTKVTTVVQPPEKQRKKAGITAKHEATHAVTAAINGRTVKKVTIIPGEGYLGLTELDKADPIAAAAPHANGFDGTGYDLFTIRASGHDVESVSSAARSITVNNSEEIHAVAVALEEKKTLDHHEVTKEISQARKKQDVTKVDIFIRNSEGEIRIIKNAKGENGKLNVKNEWLIFSISKRKDEEHIAA